MILIAVIGMPQQEVISETEEMKWVPKANDSRHSYLSI